MNNKTKEKYISDSIQTTKKILTCSFLGTDPQGFPGQFQDAPRDAPSLLVLPGTQTPEDHLTDSRTPLETPVMSHNSKLGDAKTCHLISAINRSDLKVEVARRNARSVEIRRPLP